MRNKMQVAHLCEKFGDFAKLSVGVNLFQICLSQSARIGPVVFIWSVQDRFSISTDELSSNNRSSLVVLREFDAVIPGDSIKVHKHVDYHVGVAASVQGPNLRDSVPTMYGSLEPALHVCDLSKKLESV